MFGKKCRRCGKRIRRDNSFCPYCGSNVGRGGEEKDYGLLGRDDFIEQGLGMRMPFGFNRIFSSLLKQIDSQFKQLDKELGKDFKEVKDEKVKKPIMSRAISISISTGTGKKPEIRVRGFGPEFKEMTGDIKKIKGKPTKALMIRQPEISEYKAKKLAKLPKEEAETRVRRLSNKIVYEINLPGVKKQEDIIINQLENSIEIKAFSKDKAYFKLLPINLPILNYKLDEEKLILELKARD